MKKTVLIDGYNLGLEKGTGVATYARNLSYEVRNLGHSVSVLYGNPVSPSRNTLLSEISFFDSTGPSSGRVMEYLDRARRAVFRPLGHSAAQIPMSGSVISRTFESKLPHFETLFNATDLFNRSQKAFKAWGRLSNVAFRERPDLVHWTYPLPIQLKRVPNIYTLHDIVPLRLPYTTLDNKRHYLGLLKKLAKQADHFVTVSECSKRDIVEILGVSPDRITNTYQSIDIPAKFRDKPEEQVAREVEGATGVPYKGYFLFWGSIEPKKNIGRLLEAYLASKVDAPLVMVGAQAWKSADELRILDDAHISFLRTVDRDIFTQKRVVRLNYAPFSLLVSLIRGAKAALFPSLYEGFGLPALEAMSLGTPVICSNTSSLPEVVADAALMVDPYDTAALAAAIRQLDADSDLRAALAISGPAQAAKFTPEAYRARLQGVYDRFL